MDLREYEAAKFELADVLRDLAATLPARDFRGSQPARSRAPLLSADPRSAYKIIDELYARLAEDRFNLVVVGRFNRGKTSLMNALLGVDRLPTGILPLTSVITSVSYGSTEKVQIEFESGSLDLDIPMEALADYVTEKGNPGNARRIRKARIALPAELLRRGVHFVDTPGLGSAIVENTRTTEAFFSETDAVICVTGYDAPLTEEEVRALTVFALSKVPTFVIVNKHDTVPEAMRGEILAFVREQLKSIFPHDVPRVFSVSATEGLAARLADDPAAAAASGIPWLEQELTRFLTQDKGVAFIAGLCERSASLLDEINPPQRSDLRSRLDTLRRRYIPNTQTHVTSLPETRRAPLHRAAKRMSTCPVCERAGGELFDFLCEYQHDLVVSPKAREALASEGLCQSHLWLYASMATDRDICLALTPLMKHVTQTLSELQHEARSANGLRSERFVERALGSECVVCRLQRQIESAALEEIAAHFVASPPTKSVESLPTICLPHLRKLARLDLNRGRQEGDDKLLLALVQRLTPATQRLMEDMQRYVLKRDAIRRGLASDEEGQAAKRALDFLAGSRAFPPQT